MTEPHSAQKNPEGNLNSGNEALGRTRQIYSILSNRDSMRIFELASSGIEASSHALTKHGFSKKRYYVRLSQLVEIGLIEKKRVDLQKANGSKAKYEQTNLGKIIYKEHVLKLEDLVDQFLPRHRAPNLATEDTVAMANRPHSVATMGGNVAQ